MTLDLEQTLSRELQQVADRVAVPPLPQLPAEQPPPSRRWVPLVAAAAAVVVVAGAVAVTLGHHADHSPQPAPSPSLPSRTVTPETLPTTEPTVPYVVGQALHVDGERVPGTWWSVAAGPQGWIGYRTDGSWWWASGTRTDPQQIPLTVDKPPVLSPNGLYVGELSSDQGGTLTGFDTRPAGEGLGGVRIDLGDQQQGTAVSVRAVLDDGRVIAQGGDTAVLWIPQVANSTVDLTKTAPGQVILANTPAGLVVTDGEDGPAYLARISDDGHLTTLGDLPDHDALAVGPSGTWLAWIPRGSLGGEVSSVRTLQAREVSGTGTTTVEPPVGYAFTTNGWAWEDASQLVATVVDRTGGERMARCGVPSGQCVLLGSSAR